MVFKCICLTVDIHTGIAIITLESDEDADTVASLLKLSSIDNVRLDVLYLPTINVC